MSETKEETTHTPTPWTVHREWRSKSGALRIDIAGADGTVLVATTALPLTVSDEEAQANAHLIAAAPELLAALRDVQYDIGHPHEHDGIRIRPGTRDKIRNAINSALGKE